MTETKKVKHVDLSYLCDCKCGKDRAFIFTNYVKDNWFTSRYVIGCAMCGQIVINELYNLAVDKWNIVNEKDSHD